MSGQLRRFASVAAALAPALAGQAPAAGALTPSVLDPGGVSVAAYGGWAAWSRADASSGRFALVERSPQGAISLPAVPESATPFDLELGPARGSGVAPCIRAAPTARARWAVTSRCSRSA